jgi:elongation factor G
MAFKMAANHCLQERASPASPVILEPIGSLKVLIPDNYMGDVIAT